MRALILIFALTATAHSQWQLQPARTTADLRGIDNVGNGIAWASGTNGTILRTTDTGAHWQLCTTPPNAEHLDFRGIQAFDANTAIAMSSGPGDQSRLYKTTDACQTWKLVFTNPDKEGFWDTIIMTCPAIGILIGDPVPSAPSSDNSAPRPFFPTFHTIDGGLTWSRNDHELLDARSDRNGEPRESIFAASNSSMILLPYTTLFVTGGEGGTLHYREYTFEHVNGFCDGHGMCEVAAQTPSALRQGPSAGGFSMAANWALDPRSTESHPSKPQLRVRNPEAHTVVIVGGDYKLPDQSDGTASICTTKEAQSIQLFSCGPATTSPHGYRSAVAYDAPTKTWITVGPNGTDISTDDGRNWRALHPTASEVPDTDQQWNALSLPYVVGPHGRIGILNPSDLKPTN
jgi:hypothetical protein